MLCCLAWLPRRKDLLTCMRLRFIPRSLPQLRHSGEAGIQKKADWMPVEDPCPAESSPA